MIVPRFTARNLVRPIVCVLYLLALTFAALRLNIPSDGARLALQAHPDFSGSVVVTNLIQQPDNLRIDDYVLQVDGQNISRWTLNLSTWDGETLNWQFGQTITYTVLRGDAVIDLPIQLRVFPIGEILRDNLAVMVFVILLQLEAAWIWRLRRDERAPQLLFVAVSSFCAFSVCWYFGTDVPTLVNSPWLILSYRVLTFIMLMLMCACIFHFSLILPHQRQKKVLSTRLVAAIYLTPFVSFPLLMMLLYTPNPTEWLHRWELAMIALIFASFLLALLAILYGYRKLRHQVPRLHVRIIAAAFAIAAVLAAIYGALPILFPEHLSTGWNVLPLLSLPVAFGLAIAVVFYRLFDIRVVIQRTLVWGALTALIIVTYVVIVGGLSVVFRVQGSNEFSLVATGVVAVMFSNVRSNLQQRVSTLLYGERDTPYQVVKRITQQIEATTPDESLSYFVRTVGTALKLPYTAIELCGDGQYQEAAHWGKPGRERVEYPLTILGEQFGRLVVSPRGDGEPLTAGDQELLRGLVFQAEMMIKMAHLNAELQTSREKLVQAREEERRRLRRDLHDGLGPALASLTLQIDAARNLLARDPVLAQDLLVSLKEQVKAALDDIRRLVYELRPPALDELGLIGAICEKAHQFEQDGTLSIALAVPASLPALPAALEVAAYRIATEAMTNVVRHAQAKTCSIHLALDDTLIIEVRDDGKGLPANMRSGVGIHSMAERAAELGGTCQVERLPSGGTLVCARIPFISMEQPR